MTYRTEHDSMGEVRVPADRYWGAQTERSRNNFPIGAGRETMPEEIIRAFAILKKAAALANRELKPAKMTGEKCDAIRQAAEEILAGNIKLGDYVRAIERDDKLVFAPAALPEPEPDLV